MLKVQHITIILVVAALVTTWGAVKTIPDVFKATKEYSEAKNAASMTVEVKSISADQRVYLKAVKILKPLYPEFNFSLDEKGISAKGKELSAHSRIESLVATLKATVPGMYWEIDQACIGKKCGVEALFTAKHLKVEQQNNG